MEPALEAERFDNLWAIGTVSTGMSDARAVLCAHGESELQRVLHRGLGRSWTVGTEYAWAPEGAPHHLLFGAVTLTPAASPGDLLGVQGTVCDSFAAFKPRDLLGRHGEISYPWMHRAPAPLDDGPLPAGVTIRAVTTDDDVATWERVVFEASGGPPSRPGELHPAGSQHQSGLTLLLARNDELPIGAALGLVTRSCVVVSAVAVLPDARGSGLGTALTQRTLSLAPGLPATLSSSDLGYRVYRRLGFVEVGRPVRWS